MLLKFLLSYDRFPNLCGISVPLLGKELRWLGGGALSQLTKDLQLQGLNRPGMLRNHYIRPN